MRGSLSMVLILGLPADFAGRSFLINLVFGVVSVSLFPSRSYNGSTDEAVGINP